MTEATARLALPFIVAGQAQKEVTHNEALLRIDALVQAAVESVGLDVPPSSPAAGQSWIVGNAPVFAWSGHAASIAIFTDGGWRFVAAKAGMTVWSHAEGLFALYTGTGWQLGRIPQAGVSIGGVQVVGERQPAIPDAAGGGTIDSEARVAVNQILVALRSHGLITP